MKIQRLSRHIRVTNDTISFSLFYVTRNSLFNESFYRITSEKVFGCYVMHVIRRYTFI